MLHADLTFRIIGCFYEVYNTLGAGFLEKVYENAFLIALREKGYFCEQQVPIQVYFRGHLVGDYYADIIVENLVVLELKAAGELSPHHEFQLINYLKATNLEVGLLLNFGEKPQYKRKIFTNDRKKALPKSSSAHTGINPEHF